MKHDKISGCQNIKTSILIKKLDKTNILIIFAESIFLDKDYKL